MEENINEFKRKNSCSTSKVMRNFIQEYLWTEIR